ncbi:MAG: YcgN family cysteine cluster protein [Gammaproteobacteria bacterium]|nr:YcgN family cysteine cluster protein [Gammaproteobacteria bacterium]
MTFWLKKSLSEMTDTEWEALCDGCGKCCLNKLEDDETGDIFYTSAACRMLDITSCRCSNYLERTRLVSGCIDVRQLNASEFSWLPSTCAYRVLAEGGELAAWHPLISGNVFSVVEAGVSVRSYAVSETQVDDLEDHIIEWLT